MIQITKEGMRSSTLYRLGGANGDKDRGGSKTHVKR